MPTPERQRFDPIDDVADDASIGEILERALGSARDLAAEEASLILVDVDEDARAIRRATALALVAVVWLASALAWAGVALALTLALGAPGIAGLAALGAAIGGVLLALARAQLPPTILAKSRLRVERRIERVMETPR